MNRIVTIAIAAAAALLASPQISDAIMRATPGCALLRTEEGDVPVGTACTYDFNSAQFDISIAAGEAEIALSTAVTQLGAALDETELRVEAYPLLGNDDDGVLDTNDLGGAKTANYTAYSLLNSATSSTANKTKIGTYIGSTGTWNGPSSVNYALRVEATGGTTDYAIYALAGGPIAQVGKAGGAGYLMTNASSLASTTNLNPGVLVSGTGSGGFYGLDLGYGNSRYRTRILASSFLDLTDISLSWCSLSPTVQSDCVDYFIFNADGSLSQLTTDKSFTYTIGGNFTRSIGVARHTTSNTAGVSLGVQGGGATSGATDKAAGGIKINPGINTGTAKATGQLEARTSATSTGTGDGTTWPTMLWGGFHALTDGSATNIVNVTVASNSAAAGMIDYSVEVYTGTDVQVEVGRVYYHVTNKAGTIANNTITEQGVQQSATSGTLATTWAMSAANPAVISLNADSSLTPSGGYPKIRYTVHSFSGQATSINL